MGVYVINYVNVNHKKISFLLSVMLFILTALIICGLAIAMLVFWAFIMSDFNTDINIIMENFKKSVENGGAIFSGTITALVSIATVYFNRKFYISQSIVNFIISVKFRIREKQLAPNNIDDQTFCVANDIVNHISSKKENATKEFYTICINFIVDNFNLIYAIYRQLYCLNLKDSDTKQIPVSLSLNDIALYNFALQPKNFISKNVLESYKQCKQIKNIMILVNGNFLSNEDRYRFYQNLTCPKTLAYSIFDIQINYSNQIQYVLRKYNIDINKINCFEPQFRCLIVIIILDSVLGYIPLKDLNIIFDRVTFLKFSRFMKKRSLWGWTFTVNNNFKVKKLNSLNIEKLFLQTPFDCYSFKKKQPKNCSLEKLLKYFYEKELYYAYIELSALMNNYNKETKNAIDMMIQKDCTAALLPRIQLYRESKLNDLGLIVQKAIILEKSGDIKGTNELLMKLNNFTPWSLNSDGKISWEKSIDNLNIHDGLDPEKNKLNILINADILNDYLAVLFENTHGIDSNRAILLKIIKTYSSKERDGTNRYWEMHISLECGKPYNNDDYLSLINTRNENFETNKWSYEYLNEMRRIYADYANSFYIRTYIGQQYNDKECLDMLNTVDDEKLKMSLQNYNAHFRRMGVGDLVMNYCLPLLVRNRTLNHSIVAFLHNNGFKKDINSLEDLTEFAVQTYNVLCNEFSELNDKSYKTTKTRIINAEMTYDVSVLNIPEKVKEIENFYKKSIFEVFISYGLALKLKLYLLKTMSLNIMFNSSIMNDFCDVEIGISEKVKLRKQYKEILQYIRKTLAVYSNELGKYDEIKFSEFSRNRFKMLFGFFNQILIQIKNDISYNNIVSYIDDDQGSLVRETMSILKIAGKLNEFKVSSNNETNSLIDQINELRYMPIILL